MTTGSELSRTTRLFLTLTCVLLATATALGASGAHLLQERLPPDRMAVFLQGVQYQFFQALGLGLIAWLTHVFPLSRAVRIAGWAVVVGIVLFSGSIYATTAGAPRSIAIIAMFGGIAFQIAWLTLAVVTFPRSKRPGTPAT